MKNIKYLLMMAATLMVGCTDDNENLAVGTDNLKSFTQISASISNDAGTRMLLTEGNHLNWYKDDAIGIYSDLQGVEKYTRINGVNSESNIFRGNEIKGNVFYSFLLLSAKTF